MDLHVHTCLSPCGDNSMVPPLIVEQARAAGLDGRNDPEAFGDQIVVDEHGRPVALEERLLIGATALKVAELGRALKAAEARWLLGYAGRRD